MDIKNETYGLDSPISNISMIWSMAASCVSIFCAIILFLILSACYRMSFPVDSVGNQEQTSWTTEFRDKN